MGRLIVRLLWGMLLPLALWIGAVASAAPRPAPAATWQAQVGGESADHALQAQAFLPTTLAINTGDTINWTMNGFAHTVTFLSGAPPPPAVVPSEAGPLFNPAIVLASGGPSYDGTGFVTSGLLQGKGPSFALTFTKAGTYSYVCLLHPGMAGQVVVQPQGSAYPLTQAEVAAQANAELYRKLGYANSLLQRAQLTAQPGASGTTNYTVINGAGGDQASVLRFLPVDLTITAGDSVRWLGDDPHELHTVTFYDPSGSVPTFLEPQPQPNGPPQFFLRHIAPEGGTRVESQGLYDSGLLGPGQSYSFTFLKPGVYTYVCVVHAAQGMTGKVVVTEAEKPASLPKTGAAERGAPLVALAAGALLFVLLGALLVRWQVW